MGLGRGGLRRWQEQGEGMRLGCEGGDGRRGGESAGGQDGGAGDRHHPGRGRRDRLPPQFRGAADRATRAGRDGHGRDRAAARRGEAGRGRGNDGVFGRVGRVRVHSLPCRFPIRGGADELHALWDGRGQRRLGWSWGSTYGRAAGRSGERTLSCGGHRVRRCGAGCRRLGRGSSSPGTGGREGRRGRTGGPGGPGWPSRWCRLRGRRTWLSWPVGGAAQVRRLSRTEGGRLGRGRLGEV